MFAVIFEVEPRPDRRGEYLELASFLKPVLETIDGFLEVERFASRQTPGRVLSLSLWRDEKAVIRWRVQGAHHEVQTKGRAGIFHDYHLRVGEIAADSHLPAGETPRQQRFDATEVGTGESGDAERDRAVRHGGQRTGAGPRNIWAARRGMVRKHLQSGQIAAARVLARHRGGARPGTRRRTRT